MKTYTYQSSLGHAVFVYETEEELKARIQEVEAMLVFIDLFYTNADHAPNDTSSSETKGVEAAHKRSDNSNPQREAQGTRS